RILHYRVTALSFPTRRGRIFRNLPETQAAAASGQRPRLCKQKTPPSAHRQAAAFLRQWGTYVKGVF
ncbi:MAG: hypothetical protein LBP64_07970, partial [Tannerella sp.]|nr:hypothetical protein [Tannerella sp.]